MKEREDQRLAFERYAEMGAGRSLTKLARKIGVSKSTVKGWSRAFSWAERLKARDGEVATAAAKGSIKTQADLRRRNDQLLQLALVQIAKALAEGRVKVTLADLDRLLRLEEFRAGRADSRQEIIARELEGKSLDELKAMLREEVASLGELVEPSAN
jgi:transposase